jgi:hypothetical protein
MSWFKYSTWISLTLLLITYATFGWSIDQRKGIVQQMMIEYGRNFDWQNFLKLFNLVETDVANALFYGFAILSVLAITFGLMAPITLITLAFGSSFKSDVRSVVSILLWSLGFVVILRWVIFFSHILLLLCAAILAKLDLQDNGFKQWQVSTLIILIGFLGFLGGVIAHSIKLG